MNKKKHYNIFVRILKIVSKTLAILLAVVLLLVALLNIPAIQTFITHKISERISRDYGIDFHIGAVKIAIPNTLQLHEIYVPGRKYDTLLYVDKIAVNVSLPALIRQRVEVSYLGIEGLDGNVFRGPPGTEYNFQFIIDAFAGDITSAPKTNTTSSTSWKVSVGHIRLSKIRAMFRDETMGMDARLHLGDLNIKIGDLNLDKPAVFVDGISLENTRASLTQWQVSPAGKKVKSTGDNDAPVTQNAALQLPDLGLGEFMIKNVNFGYKDSTAGMLANVDLGRFFIKSKSMDLPAQKISLKSLELSDAVANLSMASDTAASKTGTAHNTTQPVNLENQLDFLPGWDFSLASLNFGNLSFGTDDRSYPVYPDSLDFNHLHIGHLNLDAKNLVLNDHQKAITVNDFSLDEKSGFNLDKLALEASLEKSSAEVKDLQLRFGQTAINGNISLDFQTINQLIDDPGRVGLDVQFQNTKIFAGDVFPLAGISPTDAILWPYHEATAKFGLAVKGTVDDLNINTMHVAVLDHTAVYASGNIKNATGPDHLRFDMKFDTIRSSRADLARIPQVPIPAGLNLPPDFLVQLQTAGTPDSVHADVTLHSSFGGFSANAFYQIDKSVNQDTVNLDLSVQQLNLAKLLNDTTMGPVSMQLKASGANITTPGKISADANGTISRVRFNSYTYDSVNFAAGTTDSLARVTLTSTDPNADVHLDLTATLDTASHYIDGQIDVKLLNLYALHFTPQKMAFITKLNLEGNYASVDNMKGCLRISNTNLVNPDEVVPLPNLTICPAMTPDSTILKVKSDLATLDLESNMTLDEMSRVMVHALREYAGKNDTISVPDGKMIRFVAGLELNENIQEYFVHGLNSLAVDTIMGNYSSDNNALNVKVRIPDIDYNNILVSGFHLDVNGAEDSLVLQAGYENLKYDSLFTGKLAVAENVKNGMIRSKISFVNENDEPDYLFGNLVELSGDTTRISFDKNGLMLDGNYWDVNRDNSLLIDSTGLRANNFLFTWKDQEIGFRSDTGVQKFVAQKFELQNLLRIIKHPDEGVRIIGGNLDGSVDIPVKDKFSGIKADLAVKEFRFFDSLIGDIHFKLNETTDKLNLIFDLENHENSIKAEGNIGKADSLQPLDIDVALDIRNPSRLETLSLGAVSHLKGTIGGNLKIQGNTGDPLINGQLHFKHTRMLIKAINLDAHLPDETITFDNKGIGFNHFTIIDAKDSKLVLDGKILTDDYKDFSFNLDLNTKDFHAISSTKADNQTFWGNLVVDAGILLKGDMNLPVVDAGITIRNGTDLTYALPGSEIEMVNSEGIVEFVSPKSSIDTLFAGTKSNYITDSIMKRIKGIDLNARLKLEPEAKFTVMIDPTSGDYTSVSGSANLNFSIDPSGSQTLTGVFEVTKGIYQLSFYGLVKKTFEFQPGSTIAWSGRPMDANMNFTAKYIVRTQSLPLVSNESTGLTDAEKNMFRQRLPFEVLLHLRGFLDEPDVSFGIELPEKYRANYPQVASKLNMLNADQNKSELNKQVFALLVTGSFIADNPLAGGGGSVESFATTAARNSVNGILADQLNKLSNKYVKGVQLNFGLTSYEEYGGGSSQTRTELDVQVSKTLLNDRLTIEATGSFDVEGSRKYSSTNTSQTYGEFSATYDLTRSGEYKLRAYRENAYDLFDGEIAYSGLSFIFEKSFNALFKRKKKDHNVTGQEQETKKK